MRQAFAGMLWSKQLYYYDVARWLDGDPTQPRAAGVAARPAATPAGATSTPSTSCRCPTSGSTPGSPRGTWRSTASPWPTSTRRSPSTSCCLLCREWFQHPNGALPAYEWDFGDVNPPVQAWAALEVFAIDGGRDLDFLSRVFDKLLVNFTWWVNREDADGSNLFEGGFLGLDNIGPLDRSHLPVGGTLEQSDATGWMASYALAMGDHRRRPAPRPASARPTTWSSSSSSTSRRSARRSDDQGLWDDTDGLFYDRLVTPDGTAVPVKVRSMVGIIPMLAAGVVDEAMLDRADARSASSFAELPRTARACATARSSPTPGCCAARPGQRQLLLGVVGIDRLERLFAKLFDEAEFLSPYGLRAMSAYHREHPYELEVEGIARGDRLRAGRVDHGDVRRQLQLARPDLVPAQLPGDQRAGALPPLLRRRLHGRVPDRVGPAAAAGRRSPTTCATG